jgi:hypothetical protein
MIVALENFQLLRNPCNLYICIYRGAGHPIARELARQQSLAVDCPKTGVPPTIPAHAKAMIRKHGYPDFMEKKDIKTYTSMNTMGYLYRSITATACAASFENQQLRFLPDPNLLFSGFDTLVLKTEVESDYAIYVIEIKRIFMRFGIKTEAELMLALPRDASHYNDDSSSYDGSINIALRAAWKALQSSFRLRFDNYRDDTVEQRRCRASAWYHVAYEDRKSRSFHSFGWIMWDILCSIRSCNSKVELQSSGAIHIEVAAAIGMSALKVWDDGMVLLLNAVRAAAQRFNRVCSVIRKSPVVVQTITSLDMNMFGSVALLLNDHGSDIDICIRASPSHSDSDTLDNVIRPSVDSIGTYVKFINSKAVPIVKMTIEEGHIATKIDISVKEEGVWKARLIRHMYAIDPTNLPFFSCITVWAKCCGIVRGFASEKRKALLNTGQLQALLLSFLFSHCEIPVLIDQDEMLENSKKSDEFFISYCKVSDAASLGDKIIAFFNYVAAMCSTDTDTSDNMQFRFDWEIPGKPFHEISPEVLKLIAERCKHAYHSLAVSRSWEHTVKQAAAFELAITSLVEKLTRSLSASIEDTTDFLALRLSYKSDGAQVSLFLVYLSLTRV